MFDTLSRFIHPEAHANRETFLIVGLGNPGREYRETRHNIGFMLIDTLAREEGLTISRMQSKALVAQGEISGHKVILAKPQTYMNLSGQAVGGLLRFYKISLDHLLVAHDDLDLPLGAIRIRPGGGSPGQKGVSSIIEKVGTQDFPRLRLGIGRPPGRMDPADYVLEPFSAEEKPLVFTVLEKASEAVLVYIERGLEPAMNLYNGPVEKGLDKR
ncbi:MAG TPA: aminoacyl-tRNA hydrolase [Anaerolineaceae bacterium]|nr:aminoacyl-tRNA hydrolase [Anaerolineaceae bacterium]